MSDEIKEFYKKTLCHSGIKGMKWGIRRFQNDDGTLTDEGRARYSVKGESDEDTINRVRSEELRNESSAIGDAGKIASSTASTIPTTGKTEHPDYSNITDDDLRNRVNRLSMEENYARLKGESHYIKNGKDRAREILQTIGSVLGIGATAVGLYATIKKLRSGSSGKK